MALTHLIAPNTPLAIIGLGYVGLPLAVARRYHELLTTDEHGSTRITENPENIRVHPCPSVAKPLPWPQDDRTSVFAQYTLRVQDRDALQARLHQAGIPTAVHYPVPLNN
jgi:UDP-2-acetamido-2-deoxy-ribo-hexuluronate aminotransferase